MTSETHRRIERLTRLLKPAGMGVGRSTAPSAAGRLSGAQDLPWARGVARLMGMRELPLRAAVTVKRPPDEVYRFWRDLENLPRFMIHLESVREIEDGRFRWKARSPLRGTVEWEAEITEDRPGELIAWRSTKGVIAGTSGSVRFTEAPGGRGTEVRVHLRYAQPGGTAGAAVARLLGEHPEQQVRDDLRRFKQVMETGEVIRSEGSPEGTLATRQLRQRPARPMVGGGVR
ncbi:SRPBCC family protein [Actinoallomurus sp. CA-150999]|uniref:SRPBCC family protein n=1 Tax=Actinoallomurus sp. CA-150999 TaxID=3239887 RepID=UPI003D91B3ED